MGSISTMKRIDPQEMAERFSDNKTCDTFSDLAGQSQRLRDQLERFAAHLNSADRVLIELYLSRQWSNRKLGELLQIQPGTVGRRIRRILQRLADPLVQMLLDPHNTLAADDRAICIKRFLQRKTIRSIAREHLAPVGRITARIEFVRGWHRGVVLSQKAPQLRNALTGPRTVHATASSRRA